MIRSIHISLTLALMVSTIHAQTDKSEADMIIYQELTANRQTENWHPHLVILANQLQETSEKGIYIVPGDSFQIKSLRSDFYVFKNGGEWQPVNDRRYPMETMVNLLLNHINDNLHQLKLRHHQYGGKIPQINLPMQNLFDLLAHNMQLYCSVTFIDEREIRAILVFHQKKFNFIHMLEMKVNTAELMNPISTMMADLYTNIPQSNVNSIFTERKENYYKKDE